MTGYKLVNLREMINELGEETTRAFLSLYSCPLNSDVEMFLKQKAIEFSKQGLSQTHLVFTSYRNTPALVGYFTIANKYITVQKDKVSKTLRKRINRFSTYNRDIDSYCLSALLIGQLGKNFANEYNKLITGDELLKMACDKVSRIQYDMGGKFVYLECEDKPKLLDFYSTNGFCEFDRRVLDKDEAPIIDGDYLVQMLKYLHE